MIRQLAAAFLGLFVLDVSAESPAVVDGNGQPLGSYLGSIGARAESNGGTPTTTIVTASVTGYVFVLHQPSGKVSADFRIPGLRDEQSGRGTLYFQSNDCSGTPYVDAGGNTSGPKVVLGGFVFNTENPSYSGLWYVPKQEISVSIAAGSAISIFSTSECFTTSSMIEDALRVFPNDPQVTGVTMRDYPGPITISQVTVPRVLFRDGFESGMATS